MTRILGLAVAIACSLGLATTTHAQGILYGDGTVDPYYGVSGYPNQAYGGFGLQYSQAVPAGGVVVNQWGGVEAVPYVASAPQAVVVQPQPRTQTTTRFGSRRPLAQPRYVLPTGSLGSSGANGVILYSPGTRYQSYGSGYGVGPYGMVDHNLKWKW